MEGRTIMVVDDGADAGEMVRHLAARAGFKGEIKGFHDAASALAFADARMRNATPPFLALVDLSLVETHGFDVVRALRARLAEATFIAVLSASTNEADIHGAFSVGADGYVEKFPSIAEFGFVLSAAENRSVRSRPICILRNRPPRIMTDPADDPDEGKPAR